jgi:DNA modification methylase
MMKVEIKEVKISEIKLNPDNPRRISKQDMDRLVKSLAEFPDMLNIREIVVDETMTILGGNMRYLALKKSGAKAATAKIVSGLTKEQKREFVIKDNSNFGEYDFDALANGWSDLPLADWGVDLPEDWLGGDKSEPADAEPQIDRAEELNKVWGVKTGDLWKIGEHRLLCGDSTKKEDVGRVMGGEKADMVFTDPPYGVSYSGRGQSTSQQTIENDDLNPDDLQSFLLSAFRSSSCNIFVCHADQKPGIRPAFENAFLDAGFHLGGTIIWVKNVASMGWQDFRAAHEPILFGWVDGEGRVRVEDRALTTVWEVGREGNYLHPTTKPIELVAIALKACSRDGAIIWDSFLGSGTTMVACQNLNRKCRGIEISPAYCAVILQRMTDAFPGIEIKKVK